MPGLAGDRDDLHRPFGDLRNLKGEQLANQIGMGPRQLDAGFAGAASHADHIAAQPFPVLIALAGHLFGGPDHAVGTLGLTADPHDDVAAGVLATILLHHPGDDVTLTGRELAVDPFVLGVAEALQHHLARGSRRDPAEPSGGVIEFADEVALIVNLASHHLNLTALAVDLDAGVGLMALGVPVRGQQRGLDGLDKFVH